MAKGTQHLAHVSRYRNTLVINCLPRCSQWTSSRAGGMLPPTTISRQSGACSSLAPAGLLPRRGFFLSA